MVLKIRPQSPQPVQELLQDPYLIDGRKINMRFYILVICNNSNISVYAYNNGFMYYTAEKFTTDTQEFGPNITTGYIDRNVYEHNPLTLEDFRKYLDSNRQLTDAEQAILRNTTMRLSSVIFIRIYTMLRDVFMACAPRICTGDKLKSAITFQLLYA